MASLTRLLLPTQDSSDSSERELSTDDEACWDKVKVKEGDLGNLRRGRKIQQLTVV